MVGYSREYSAIFHFKGGTLMNEETIMNLIRSTSQNEARIRSHPQMCGCYRCMAIFPSSELKPDNSFRFPEQEDTYVSCEYCGFDGVVCEDDLEGIAPLNKETLKQIHEAAFSVRRQF